MEYRQANRCPNLDDYDGNGEDDGHLLRQNDFPRLWDEDENYVRPVKRITVEEYMRRRRVA